MFTWLEGSCTSPLVGSTPGGKCDWIYVFMHVGLVYSRQHLDFFVFVSKIDTFIRICKYRERLLHLRSIVHQWQRHLLQVRAGKEIVLKKSNCNKKATVLKKREIVLQKNNCVTTKEISKLKLLKLFWNLKYQHNGLSSLGSNGTNIKFQIYPKHIQPRHKTNKGSFHSLPFFLKNHDYSPDAPISNCWEITWKALGRARQLRSFLHWWSRSYPKVGNMK